MTDERAFDSHRLVELADWCDDIIGEVTEHERRLRPNPEGLIIGADETTIVDSLHRVRAHALRAKTAAQSVAARKQQS